MIPLVSEVYKRVSRLLHEFIYIFLTFSFFTFPQHLNCQKLKTDKDILNLRHFIHFTAILHKLRLTNDKISYKVLLKMRNSLREELRKLLKEESLI